MFEKIKNDSMTNNTFTHFMSILQQLSLIPNNETGILLWDKITEIVSEISGIENEGFL